ncbi:MAG: glutamate--tRNA ligase family protein [Ferruginibacter sp.]
MITRLAPTPSGFIHAGNIYNFLLSWLWARSNGGKIFLRIDDIDAERKRPQYVEDIFRVLDWLGLDWDIGPLSPDDFEKNWSQSKRTDLYNTTLNELITKNLLFACNCSRKQPVCHCIEKKLNLATAGTALKIKQADNTLISFNDKALGPVTVDAFAEGCFILKRKDGIPAYQLASLADDRHFGITHICRGEDLLTSTGMQLYIDKKLSDHFLMSCTFWHHSMIADATGDKLSKSAGSLGESITGLVKKEDLVHSFVKWMGLKTGTSDIKEMIGLKLFTG